METTEPQTKSRRYVRMGLVAATALLAIAGGLAVAPTATAAPCTGYVQVICDDGNTGPGGPTCEVYLSDTCRARV